MQNIFVYFQLKLLDGAYHRYLGGLREAVRLLEQLQGHPEVASFLKVNNFHKSLYMYF